MPVLKKLLDILSGVSAAPKAAACKGLLLRMRLSRLVSQAQALPDVFGDVVLQVHANIVK